MNSRARTYFRSVGAIVAVLVVSFAPNFACAQGTEDVAYKVLQGKAENPAEHNNAVYAVFESIPGPEKRFGRSWKTRDRMLHLCTMYSPSSLPLR